MKLIPRSSDQDHVQQDQHIDAVQTLYAPYSGVDAPSINGNDEDKIGAIATHDVGGVKFLSVYQGGGVWKDIPYTPTIANEVKQFVFTRSNITNVVDGMGDLVLPFNGGQISLGLISRAEITEDGIPKGALVANLSGGPVTSYNNQLPDVDQYGIVYYIGESIEFSATLLIDNNSSADVNYTVSGIEPPPLAPGGTISQVTLPGLSISLDLEPGQTCVYTVYDNIGGVVFTHTLSGPGTENGIPMTDDQSQSFIIGNTLP